MSVTLKNKTRRMKVIPLPHKTYCAALGECACVALPGIKNKVATSLTIPAGESVPDIPDAVLAVDQVVRMVRRGELDAQRTPKGNDTIPKDLKKKRPSRKRKRNES